MTEDARSDRLVRIPAASLADIHSAVAEGREPRAAAEALRRLGLRIGAGLHALFVEWFAENEAAAGEIQEVPDAEFWAQLSDFLDAAGFGPLRHADRHPGILELSSDDWAEASSRDGVHLGCQISTGLIAELLRRTAGDDLAVLEAECRGEGAERCRFLVGSEDSIGRVFETMSGGAGCDAAIAALPAA